MDFPHLAIGMGAPPPLQSQATRKGSMVEIVAPATPATAAAVAAAAHDGLPDYAVEPLRASEGLLAASCADVTVTA